MKNSTIVIFCSLSILAILSGCSDKNQALYEKCVSNVESQASEVKSKAGSNDFKLKMTQSMTEMGLKHCETAFENCKKKGGKACEFLERLATEEGMKIW